MKNITKFLFEVFLLSMLAFQGAAAPVTDGLVVYYDGNLSGNSLIDLSGNNNIGYATSVTSGTNQSTGASYIKLNGVNSKINISNNAQTNVSSPISVEFIGSIDTFSRYGALVSKYNALSGWYLSCSPTAPYNTARFSAVMKNGTQFGYNSNISLVAGQVYNIVVTYDNNIVHIYVNGVDSAYPRTWNSQIAWNTYNTTIGSGYYLNYSNSSLYTFRLYNRSLSPAEILQNYNNDRWRCIPRLTPTITWSNPANISYGTALSETQLNAAANDPETGNNVSGNFVYDPASGTILGAGTHTLQTVFTSYDTTNYTTASWNVSLSVNKATPLITWSNPVDITTGTPLSEAQLNANASVPGSFVYTPAAGTVLGVGTHTLHVDFTPNDTANYTSASKDVTINVGDGIPRITPAINWSNPANITHGTVLSSIQLNAFATDPETENNVTGTYVYTPVAGTVLSAGAHTLRVDFTPDNTVNYTNASKNVTINVSQVTPTIIWSNPANITYGTALSGTQLNASASVPGNFAYSPASGTILGAGIHTLQATFIPTDTTNYTTASGSVSLTVNQTTPLIVWSNPAGIANGTALSSTQLNAIATNPATGNSVPGNFVYTPAEGTLLSVGTHTLHTDFTANDTANYTNASRDVTINVSDVIPVTPAITWSNPANISYGTELSSTQLNAAATDPDTGNNVSGTPIYTPAAGTLLGVGTHTLHVDFTPADTVKYTNASKDVTINVEKKNELQLWTFDASKVSAVPDNVYTASKNSPYISNMSLTYNSTSSSIDSKYWRNDNGEVYFAGAYPSVNENLTFTMGFDSNSPWSYGYMHTSVAHVGLRHASDGSYWIYSYWTADNGTQLNSNFQIPAASVVNNRVTVSICSYDSNRTNVIRSGPTLKVTTPYTTETTRKLPYTNVIQPLIYADCYASGTGGWVNLHFYNITQSIPRDIITPYARNDIMGFGFDYPNVPNNKNGTDFLISRGQSASVYLSDTNMANSTDIAYDQSLFANGFEEGIHFYPGLTSQSLEQAKQTIDTHMAAAEATFGSLPTSWACHQNEDTITHAIYAYNKYGALYRNGPMGMAFITNVDTLSNETWAWWSVSSARGAVSPCFTHRTDEYPAIPYSIDPDLFENFVTNLNSNGINLVNFSNWYYSSMAQNATIKNIEYDANYTEFQLNTSGGYPVIINMQIASHSQLYYNGVPIPFNQTSDGIQFMSAGNGTYTLTGPQVPPVANFTADLTVQFTDTSTNRPIRWDWNFGDGSTSTEQNPVHVYGDEGTYNITLVATNTGGSSDVRSLVLAINNVAANFTANKTEGTAPLTVQFTDTSTNSPTSWNWNFGDGNFSTEQNPEHTFGDDGIYNVTLVATNAGNSSSPGSSSPGSSSPGSSPGSPSPADPSVVDSSDVKSMNIIVKEPSADFTANRTEGTAPLTVQFTDTSTNSPTSWDWNFGDGNSSTEQNPVHVFSINGTYNVTLVATNAGGSSDVKAMNITVNRVLIPPVANFTANRTEGTAPLTVQFTDTSTNSPTSRDWNFGDGANSTDANPVHVYATAGTYVANLTASNADGTDTESKTITVTGPVMGSPKARFTAVPQMGSAPLTVNFTDNSVNATSIVWDFGDRSATSTEANPSHIYKTAGFYTVKLTATSGSKSSVASKIIVVGK